MNGHRQYKITDYRFGQMVVGLREKVGLTQKEVGDSLNVSRRTIQHWEAGTAFPDTNHIKALIAFFLPFGTFTKGSESVEARSLWDQADESAARRKSLFDEAWFETILREFSPKKNDNVQILLPADNASSSNIDWGDAPDVREVHGRQRELAELSKWVIDQNTRLVVIHGMGGIGKTTLAAKFAQTIIPQFEYLIWRSLHHAPSLDELLLECLQILSPVNTSRPTITLLLEQLQRHRCLLVLDNMETLQQNGSLSGEYREGYEGYPKLFQRLAQTRHKSCVLLTSRNLPVEIEPMEGALTPVRTMRLSGLAWEASQTLLEDKGLFGPAESWNVFVQYYGGNPLALKIAANTVRDLFGGDLVEFLKEAPVTLHTLQQLLDNQFDHLSALERDVMFWLAIERDFTSLDILREDLTGSVSKSTLLSALTSLRQRSLIERGDTGAVFNLQPVLLEYVTNRIVTQVSEEIEAQETGSITKYALIKGQDKDYVRESQIRMILTPILELLTEKLGNKDGLSEHLRAMIKKNQGKSAKSQGYASGNLASLLICLNGNIKGEDFSRLVLWQINLQGVDAQDANFSGTDFIDTRFTEPIETIGAMSLSPTGRYLAASTYSGEIRFWRVADRKPLWNVTGVHREWSLAFNHDESILASGGFTGQICLWDTTNGKLINKIQGHRLWVHTVVFQPDGERLASGGYYGTVRVWNVKTMECQFELAGHTGQVMSIAFSPDGSLLVSSGVDGTIRIWEMATGSCLNIIQHDRADSLVKIAMHPNGNLIASCSEDDPFVKLWDIRTGECVTSFQSRSNELASIAIDPTGEMLACGNSEGSVEIWKLGEGISHQYFRTLMGHQHYVGLVSFAQEGLLATLPYGENIKLWDVQRGKLLKTIQGYSRLIGANAISPDGKMLMQGDANGMIRVWDLANKRYLSSFQGHAGPIWRICFSPDGKKFASCGDDRVVRLWDRDDLRCLKTFAGHTGVLWELAFSPDGLTLASGGTNRKIKLWDTGNNENVSVLRNFGDISEQTWSIAFDPEGKIMASGHGNGIINLWQVETGEHLGSITHGVDILGDLVGALRFSQDGKTLFSSSNNVLIKWWDVATKECRRVITGKANGNRNKAVAIGPDGDYAVTGSGEPVVCLWHVDNTGDALTPTYLGGHTSRVWAIAFSSTEKIVVSSDEEGTSILSDIESETILHKMSLDRPYERMKINEVKGLNLVERAALIALGASESAG